MAVLLTYYASSLGDSVLVLEAHYSPASRTFNANLESVLFLKPGKPQPALWPSLRKSTTALPSWPEATGIPYYVRRDYFFTNTLPPRLTHSAPPGLRRAVVSQGLPRIRISYKSVE